jgi:heavy metal sensor kinase
MKRIDLPIRWRLTIWYSAILALVLVVFACGVYMYFKNSLQANIDAKIRSIGDVLSSSMTETHNPSVFMNFERYLENVLGKKPKGKFIQIMDRSGKIGAKMSDIETEAPPASFTTLEKALAGEVVYETVERSKPRLRIVTIPIFEQKKTMSIVQVATSLEDFDETMYRLLIILVIGIPTSLSVTVVVGYFMAKKALKPVDKIRRAAVKISSRNLDERIDIGARRDELGRLSQTFNEMIGRLQNAFQRVNQFSSDVSHELKTPLTILKGETEVALRKERESEQYRMLLSSHLEEIDRMTKIIDDLLLLSKADAKEVVLNVDDIHLKDLIVDVCMDMKFFADKKGVGLIVNDLDDVKLKGDELKLRRMLLNVIENGIKYTPEGGSVAVKSFMNNGSVQIDVQDTGIGIPPEELQYVFDRFYRGDKSRKRETGSGLGLSISKWIAEAHRGTIEVAGRHQRGSLFSITLPVS